jgi:uncharacterized protein (TIGR03437 family)
MRLTLPSALFLALTGPLLAGSVGAFGVTEVAAFQPPLCSPPPIAKSFKSTSTEIWAFLRVDNVSNGDVAVVEWVNPRGELTRSFQALPLPFPSPVPVTSWCFLTPLVSTKEGQSRNLALGDWTAQVRFNGSVAAAVNFEIAVADPLIQWTIPATYVQGAIPAGGYMTIGGRGFCTPGSSQLATQTPWPTSLAGTSVLVDGEPAPLAFVGENSAGCQINAQLPWTAAEGPHEIRVRFEYGSIAGLSEPTIVQAAAITPSFFSAPPQYPVLLQIANRDYVPMTLSNPVYPGEILVGYADGFGQTDPPRVTGYPAQVAAGEFARVTETVEAWLKVCIGTQCTSVPATIVYALAYPASPAAYQLAFTMPEVSVDAAAQYSLVIQVGGKRAPDMPLYMAPRP